MSENKRRNTKITIETESNTSTIECDGIAGITVSAEADGEHEAHVVLVGSLSIADLMAIHKAIENELLPVVKANTVETFFATKRR